MFTLMTIEDIVLLCNAQSVRWTSHILQRMFRRGISRDDVVNALTNGEIIEQYPTDYPFPSCLVMGYTKAGKVLCVWFKWRGIVAYYRIHSQSC